MTAIYTQIMAIYKAFTCDLRISRRRNGAEEICARVCPRPFFQQLIAKEILHLTYNLPARSTSIHVHTDALIYVYEALALATNEAIEICDVYALLVN